MRQINQQARFSWAAFGVVLVTLSAAGNVLALERQDVGLYVPFENTLQPELVRGEVDIQFNLPKHSWHMVRVSGPNPAK